MISKGVWEVFRKIHLTLHACHYFFIKLKKHLLAEITQSAMAYLLYFKIKKPCLIAAVIHQNDQLLIRLKKRKKTSSFLNRIIIKAASSE